MRGAVYVVYEYIHEPQSEITVGIDVVAHVIVLKYRYDTCKDSCCEAAVN